MSINPGHPRTFGLLYGGDMGSAFGRLLAQGGARVVTTLEGRSERTARLTRAAELEVLPAFEDVVRQANVVFCIVPPAAAAEVAERFCRHARIAPKGSIYVDANAIRPEAKLQLAKRMTSHGINFVDGAIHGVSAQLAEIGTLYLSGPRAAEVAEVPSRGMRVRVLGDEPGQASAFKMLLGGMSKGLVALFLEMSLLASRQGMLADLVQCYRHFYPGIMGAVDRILPTYPRHVGRRADEMLELETMMRSVGMEPHMIEATRQILVDASETGFPEQANWTIEEVVEHLFKNTPANK